MSAEQRRALAGTIPTTEVIRDAVTFPRDRLGEPLDISPERFDAWLAEEVLKAKAEALRDVVEKCAITIPDALGYKVPAVTVEDLLETADEHETGDSDEHR